MNNDNIYEYASSAEEAKANFERLKSAWVRSHKLEAALRGALGSLSTVESLANYASGEEVQLKLIKNIVSEARKKINTALQRA